MTDVPSDLFEAFRRYDENTYAFVLLNDLAVYSGWSELTDDERRRYYALAAAMDRLRVGIITAARAVNAEQLRDLQTGEFRRMATEAT